MRNHFIRLSLALSVILSSWSLSHAGADEYEYLYLITFKDKSLNYVRKEKPETYLTRKALDRREKFNIAIDSMDYPVSKAYSESLKKKGLTVLYPTRWLNGVVVITRDQEEARRSVLLFYVDKVHYLGKKRIDETSHRVSDLKNGKEAEEIEHDTSMLAIYAEGYEQLDMLNGIGLHKLGYTGKGVTIAVLDAGFYAVDRLHLFESLFKNGQIKGTYDFVDMEKDVYEDDNHGLHVFTCLAANQPGKMVGSAPDADFYLFRTENEGTEYLYEELNWIRAAEVADSLGVDIINSSLGYTYFDDKSMNHTWDDLGGGTWISMGARIAAEKGILVVNAAGNEGDNSWKYVNPPADIPEVLSVGAVHYSGDHVKFSSIGHPHLEDIKPDICAPGYGVKISTNFGRLYTGNGTSYACPIVAGLSACLLQAHPDADPALMIRAIENSADKRLHPDSALGNGVPDFMVANLMLTPLSGRRNQFVLNSTFGSDQRKLVVYEPNGDKYEAVFYQPSKFIFFTFKKNKIKTSGSFFSSGFTILDTPSQVNGDSNWSVKMKIQKEDGGHSKWKRKL